MLMLLNLWMPCAGADISRDLDPMVSPEVQATVTSDKASGSVVPGEDSDAVMASAAKEEKKIEEPKKKKSKKKSSEKNKKKSSSGNFKKHKKNSR